jgi:hypothetical protein
MPLDLLLPGLRAARDAPETLRSLRLPSLEKWLARADSSEEPARGAQGWLAAHFGLAIPPPMAALALAGEGADPGAAAWLRADPVHLRIENDRVRLHHCATLDIGEDEAAAFVAALGDHFARDGLALRAAAPDRWYARVEKADLPTTTPIDEAVGRDVYPLMPAAGGSFNWRSAMTEAQMVLSEHPANRMREAAGLPAVNSVWFWGEGVAPAILPNPYANVFAGDAFARGLGVRSGAEVHPAARDLTEVTSTGRTPSLVVIDDAAAALRLGSADAWKAAATSIDERWFANIGAAIARFGGVRVILPGETNTRIASLTPASRWRWFRTPRSLATHA